MDQYIGRLLDNRYEILEIIGTGGMAVVYKARCHRLNRLVAIKILKDEFARDEEFRRRFRAEGEAVAMLSHPNIVQVYDVSSTDSANYIVMELIDGISLKQYMEKKGVLNWKETLHFAMQIAKGLEHAHSRGIVHRDIKPHNVMVLKNGSVKVMDFGIARVMSKSNTLTKEALGSVHYISPEQAKGGWVDNRSDLYSLGVVMYEMMTGRPPYDGESPVAVAIQHINGGAVMPSALNPNIPGGLEQIIMKSMALDVKDRYSSATEMLRDMEEFRKNPMILFPWAVTRTGVSNATQPIPAAGAIRTAGTTAGKIAHERAGSTAGRTGASRNTGTGARTAGTAAPGRRPSTDTSRGAAQQRRSRRAIEEEEKRSRMTTIAIVTCCVVAMIAIAIFLVALMSGALFKTEMVLVPNLLGETYYSGMTYNDLIIKVEHSYNSDYEKGIIFDQNPSGGIEVVKGAVIKVSVSLGEEPEVKHMEDLRGLKEEDAVSFLRGQGMNPLPYTESNDEVEAGRVIRTDPEAGEELSDGQAVKVYVSSGPEVKLAQMPNVVGMGRQAALERLAALDFKNVDVEYVENEADRDEVVKQSATKYVQIDVTTHIILYVSKGPAETKDNPTRDTTPEPSTEEPTEESTEAATEESTAPEETTEASEPESSAPAEVTKIVPIPLPEREEAYLVSLYYNGQVIREATQILPGTVSIRVELTGSGTQTFQIWINGSYYSSYDVVFN